MHSRSGKQAGRCTTGKAKGAMTSGAGFVSYLESLSSVAHFNSRSVSLSTMPLNFVDALPKTPSGKVIKYRLRAQYADSTLSAKGAGQREKGH